jgi:hypothetical protein
MQINGQPYHITVERENPTSDFPVYMAVGAEYKDPMESLSAFGSTPEEAVSKFLEQMGKPQKFYELVDDPDNPGLQKFIEINDL